MEDFTIEIKYHHEDLKHIETFDIGDWIDLRTAEEVTLKKGEFKLISLGVSMKMPKGYEALVAPRSSTFKKYKVLQANSLGVIDSSFNGDKDVWKFPALALGDTHIPMNTRICQFRLMKNQIKPTFKIVDNLGGEARGGFGEGTGHE